MRRRTLVTIAVGLLPVWVLVGVVVTSSLQGPEPPVPTTTLPTIVIDTTTATTTTTMTKQQPELFMSNNGQVAAIRAALALVKRYDPKRYERMQEWFVTDCANLCKRNEIAFTELKEVCVTHISTERARRDAAMVTVPARWWLASILVHEYVHCTPEGDNEWPALQAQIDFAETWPNPYYRERVNVRIRYDFTRLDREGHWR